MRRTVQLISGSVATLIVERDSITLRASSPSDGGIEHVYRFTPSEWSQLIAGEGHRVSSAGTAA